MKSRLYLIVIFIIFPGNIFSHTSYHLKNKVIFVCGNNPPYEYINEDGEPEGFNIDLVKEIMKRIDSDYEIKLFNWNEALNYAKDHENAVVIGMIYSEETSKSFRFTTPYEYVSLSIISNPKEEFHSLRELNNKSVIVIKGSYEEQLINQSKDRLNIKPILINKVQEGVEMIHHKIADAFIVNSSMGAYTIKLINIDLNINEMKDQPTMKYCMASSIKNDSIITQINSSLSNIKLTGAYNVIYDKWMKTIVKDKENPSWVNYFVVISVVIILCAIIFSIFIQKKIRKNRSEINIRNDEINKINEQLSLIIKNTNSGYLYLSSNLDVIWESISKNKSFNYNNIYSHIGSKCYSMMDETTMCKRCPVRRAIFTGMTQISENMLGDTPIEQTAIPILDNEGFTKGIILKIEDISQQKIARDELIRAKEKAEESDKLKSAFLANVSHEFRTPLNSIMGFSSLLVDEENKEEREKYMDIIQMNSDMLINLIEGLLDMSRIEIGDVKIENLEFNINDLFISIKSNLNKTFTLSPNVEFIIERPMDMLMLNLDFRRTEQILLNFLTNASKYTEHGSITIGYDVTESEIRFYVKDTGCGIPEDKINKLFISFQKLDSFKQGIGLGLSIAKTIAIAMGGRLSVESVVNEGSIFWLIFPKNIASNILEEV